MTDFKIKPDLKDEWIRAAGNSCCDGYSFGVVQATVAAFGILDSGGTCKEAEDKFGEIGISGYMAGCCAGWISRFHERGEEFRIYWNKQWGVDEDKANGGVVNPAIMTIGE